MVGRRDKNVELTMREPGACKELMVTEGKFFGLNIRIILVYFDSDKKVDSEGARSNRVLRREVEDRIEDNDKDGLIILGDMNGHIERLDGRKEDINGKMIWEWLDTYDLILINGDDKCKGVFTWEGRGGRSRTAINMVLVNREVYEKCRGMVIDENKEVTAISDHNLVTIELKLGGGGGRNLGGRG